MLVYFILLMFYIIHGGKCLEGLNVCEDWRRTEYCCAGYEEKHGTCIECNNGFTSLHGNACTSCKNNRFGKRCLTRCNCQSVQERCDNVAGCVPKTEVSEISPSNITTIVYVLCAGSLVVIIGLSVYFRQHCRRKSTIGERIASHRNDNDGFPMPILELKRQESIYNIIDEQNTVASLENLNQHMLIDDNQMYDYPFN